MTSFSPWKRKRPVKHSRGLLIGYQHTLKEKFDWYTDANIDLDIDTKRAALKVSTSVVSLASFTGGKLLFASSGTIIDSEYVNGTYFSTILTSASLLGASTELDAVPDDIEVYVYLLDVNFLGQLFCYDFYYNIATIKIESEAPLPTASLKFLDDSIPIDLSEIRYPRDNGVGKLCPGDVVVAMGRFFEEPYELMAAPGKFSVDCCYFDCKELLRANCQISICGIGGPLVNRYGEVIGVNFYDKLCTPFIPINIAFKCLEHFKKYGRFCRPCLGLEMTNLYGAPLAKLEGIINKNNNTFKGVFVEEVATGSSAHSAGIFPGDVIVQCGEKFVRSLLEFSGIVWDKVGQSVEVVVIRGGAYLNLIMVVDGTSPDKFYRWPLPKKCKFRIENYRPR